VAAKRLTSWDDARSEIRSILDRINADSRLVLAAAANPIFALEELGYEVDPAFRSEFEQRLRFGQARAARLRELRTTIARHAGREFDPDSPEELERVLVSELRIAGRAREVPAARARKAAGAGIPVRDFEPLFPRLAWTSRGPDPLEVLRSAHPIVEPLLEYRELEASEPRLASRATYDALRSGEQRVPVTRLRAVLKAPRRNAGG
jgi:hypothetical protein